jgi:cell division septal protein FtsQ
MIRPKSRSFSAAGSIRPMKTRVLPALLVLLLVVAVGGLAVLGTWDMPAPSKAVEKVLADERFPR